MTQLLLHNSLESVIKYIRDCETIHSTLDFKQPINVKQIYVCMVLSDNMWWQNLIWQSLHFPHQFVAISLLWWHKSSHKLVLFSRDVPKVSASFQSSVIWCVLSCYRGRHLDGQLLQIGDWGWLHSDNTYTMQCYSSELWPLPINHHIFSTKHTLCKGYITTRIDHSHILSYFARTEIW